LQAAGPKRKTSYTRYLAGMRAHQNTLALPQMLSSTRNTAHSSNFCHKDLRPTLEAVLQRVILQLPWEQNINKGQIQGLNAQSNQSLLLTK